MWTRLLYPKSNQLPLGCDKTRKLLVAEEDGEEIQEGILQI